MHVRKQRAGRPPGATKPASDRRATQADRSARTRSALLESAARGLSRYGYGNLVLERVASDAGYTRGALYHQFKDKEDLALAVIDWADQTWREEVGGLIEQEPDPVIALILLARGHAILCRRDVARVAVALRLEFSGHDHPVGRQLARISDGLLTRCARLISAGRRAGTIPAGPPPRAVALAFIGAVEGTRDRARRAGAPRRGAGGARSRRRARAGLCPGRGPGSGARRPSRLRRQPAGAVIGDDRLATARCVEHHTLPVPPRLAYIRAQPRTHRRFRRGRCNHRQSFT